MEKTAAPTPPRSSAAINRENARHYQQEGQPARTHEAVRRGAPVKHTVSETLKPHLDARAQDFFSPEGFSTQTPEMQAFMNWYRRYFPQVAIPEHNAKMTSSSSPALTKAGSDMAFDFFRAMIKEAYNGTASGGSQMDYRTRQRLNSAKQLHRVPEPVADKTNRFGQYGGYDWSGYNPAADSAAPKDLSGVGGYKSLAGGWEPTGYMENINSARQRMLDNKHGIPNNDAYLESMGVRRIEQPPSPTAQPSVGTAAYNPPVGGGALGATSPGHPVPGTPEYDEAMRLRIRGSDDYQAARRGEGYMGYRPDGTWGLVTPSMKGQPAQGAATPPAVAPPTPPAVAPPTPPEVSQTTPDPFEGGRTTGPGQFNNLPPAPVGFDASPTAPKQYDRSGSGARIAQGKLPFQGPSRPVTEDDLLNVTTGPNQFTNLPPSPAGFGGSVLDLLGNSPLNVTTGPNQFTNLPPSPEGFGGSVLDLLGNDPFNVTTGPNQFTNLPPSPEGFDIRNLLSSPWAGIDPRFQRPRSMNPWQSLYGLNA